MTPDSVRACRPSRPGRHGAVNGAILRTAGALALAAAGLLSGAGLSAKLGQLGPPDPAGAQVPSNAAGVLRSIRERDSDLLAVSEEDGRFLRTLVAASRVRRALEIGTARGYSAIWIGLGLRETGGRLVTIEYDPGRAREAAASIRRAGLDDIVTVVPGDAFKEVPRLAGTFDFVFLDAWKRDYKRFLDLTLPRLDPGGLFLAHNVVNKRDEMGEFLAAIEQSKVLLTSIVTPSGEGISISYKRR